MKTLASFIYTCDGYCSVVQYIYFIIIITIIIIIIIIIIICSVQANEAESAVQALETSQAKSATENNDLSQQLADADSKLSSLSKAKKQLETQLEDTKSDLSAETSVRI